MSIYRECINCNRVLSLENFSKREDRFSGYYHFCEDCMKEQNRSKDYPEEKERGAGVLSW